MATTQGPTLALTIDGRAARVGAVQFERAVDRVTRSGRQAEGQVDRLNRSFGGLRAGMAGLAAAVGTGAIFSSAIRNAVDFDRALTSVRKDADISGQALKDFGDELERMSQDVMVGGTAIELAEIAAAAGRLGVRGTESILAFTKVAAQIGDASNLAATDAATALARISVLTNEPIENVDRLGSVMVELGRSFATTEADIAHTATRIAQDTARFGVASEEVLGLSAALAAFGIQAEGAGTAIANVFDTLDDRTAGGFLRFVERIRDSGRDVGEALREVGLNSTEARRVIGTLVTRYDELERAMKSAAAEFKAGNALLEESAAASEKMERQLEVTRNTFTAVSTELGTAMAPALLEVAEGLRDVVQSAQETGRLTAVFQNLGSAALFAAENMDKLVIAGSALVGLRLGAAFGPLGAIIGAVGGAVTGLAGALWLTHDATDAANEITVEHEGILYRVADATNRAGEVQGRYREELLATAKQEISTAKAALERARALEQISRDLAPFGITNPPIDEAPFVKKARENLDIMEQRLRITQKALRTYDTYGTPVEIPEPGGYEPSKRKPEDNPALAAPQAEIERLNRPVTTGGGGSLPTASEPETVVLSSVDEAAARALETLKERLRWSELYTESIGRTRAEVAALNAEYQFTSQLEREGVTVTGDLIRQRDELVSKIRQQVAETERLQEETDRAQQLSQGAARSVGSAFEDAIFNIRGAGDALSIFGGLLEDISRQLLRTSFTDPLVEFLGGGGSGGGGGIFGKLFGSLFHSGGIVGGDSAPRRAVSPMMFAGAPRLHDGLKPDEFPAILQKGEGVFTPAQMRNLAPAGGGGGTVVNQTNNITVQGGGGGDAGREQARQIERSIKIATEQAIAEGLRKQQRPGGLLNPMVATR